MSFFRVLHLSDIHIGKTYKPSEDIAYKIISDIEYNGLCPINSVAVTGDIFDGQITPDDKLINEAVKFFDILLEQINYSQPSNIIAKKDIIFVPGNHDLIRVDDEKERWSKYNKFLVSFYGTIPEWYDKNDFSVFLPYHQNKIVFIGFNSCQIEKRRIFDSKYINTLKKHMDTATLTKYGFDKEILINILENEVVNEYDDYGNISMSQISNIERKVKTLDNYNVITLFHHHFYLFPEVAKEFGDSSLVRNYTEVIQHLKYMNVKTVLHGHKHFDLERPFITEDYYDTTESIIDVFAGGSVGTSRKERHTFGVIDFYDRKEGIKLAQNKFVYNIEMLETICKKQIPPQNLSSRVIKILELLEILNIEAYTQYINCTEKIFKMYYKCSEITNWVSEALTGFKDSYKYLNSDSKNILFMLYAINFRSLSYKTFIDNDEAYYESTSILLKEFFDNQVQSSAFSISKEEYHSLFSIKDLRQLANKCDCFLNKSSNKSTQQYLAFSMIGIFFTDYNG